MPATHKPRVLVVDDEPAVYHVISRTALDGFVLGDVEKEYLLSLIQRLSAVWDSQDKLAAAAVGSFATVGMAILLTRMSLAMIRRF
mgnify:CR=1 FL=1